MTNSEMKVLLEKALCIEVDEERAAWVLAGVEAAQHRVQSDLRHACGDCGEELQIVRPGKYQCVNPKCCASR